MPIITCQDQLLELVDTIGLGPHLTLRILDCYWVKLL